MSEDRRNRLGHGNMTKMITFFIIGFLILGPRECWGFGDPNNRVWWKTALFYEVSWRFEGAFSFRNFSDFTPAIDSLKKLGVDALCLHTIFPWANDFDSITNYTDVNKNLGTMADIEQLIADAHRKGIKVILDVVPFYTSDQHQWFHEWEENREIYNRFYLTLPGDGAYTERYVLSAKQQENYFAVSEKHSPALDIAEQAVRSHLNEDIFTFWLDKGVDGFRIEGLSPYFDIYPLDPNNETVLHVAEKYLKEVRGHVDKWTKDHNSTPKYLAVETPATGQHWFDYYGMPDSPGVVPLNDALLSINGTNTYAENATSLLDLIQSKLQTRPQYESIGWMLSRRDYPRLSSRVGERKAAALTMLMMLLPGHAYMLAADDKNMGDSRESDGINLVPGPSRYTCIFARIVALRKLPIFARDGCYFASLHNDAILMMWRYTGSGSTSYMVLINLADTEQKVNLPRLFGYFNNLRRIEIVVKTDTNATTIGEVQHRDSVHVPPNAGIVVRSVGTEPESFIDKTVEKEFCEEPEKNDRVPKESTDKPTNTGENEPSGEGEEKKHVETGGKEGSHESSQPGKNETTETDVDVVSLKPKGDATTEKPEISGENGPGVDDKEEKPVETGSKEGRPEPSQPGKNETTETDMDVVSRKPKGDATTEKPEISGENGSSGEGEEKIPVETGSKEGRPEPSQPGKNETTKTDMDVVSPKKESEAKTEKPKISGQIDQGRGDEEHKSVGKGGKEARKSGDDAAANGKKDERVKDDPKEKGKEVNKDEGRVVDEKTTGWGELKPFGKFWRSFAQSFTRYWRKKLVAVSRLKLYLWNRQ